MGEVIISESCGFEKVLFKILKLDLFVKFHNILGHNTVFIKLWGQTVNFGKCFTVAVTVASGLPDTDKRQAEFGAVSIQNENGLPDSKNRKSGFGAVSTRTKAANRMSINGKPVTTKNVHNG